MTSIELPKPVNHVHNDQLANWQIGRLSPMPSHLPDGWQLVRLTSVAVLESGHTPSRRHPEYWDGDIPWISLHDSANLDVPVMHTTAQTISGLGLEHSSARLLPKGTVVFSRTATVGKSTVMGSDMATSQDFANYICGNRLHNRYLMHLFRFMAPEWKRLMAGSTFNTIYMPVFKELQILLPPIKEQEAIAETLSDADAFIEALEQLIAKKRQVKQGAMQELFTGKRRLLGFSEKWEDKRLGELSEMGSGGTPLTSNPNFYDGDIPWVSIADMTQSGKFISTTERNITTAGLNNSAAQMFPSGTVLYAMYASLGECSIAHVSLSTSQAILGIRVKSSLHNEFLYYFLTYIKSQVKTMGQHGTQANLNKRMVQDFQLKLPPLPEQTAIAEILSDMDAEIAALEEKLSKARQVKQGMMQELLTGRVRLV